jgi:hypothetical protein
MAMSDMEPLEEFIRRMEGLGVAAEDKAFLISVQQQFDAEMAAAAADANDRDQLTDDE